MLRNFLGLSLFILVIIACKGNGETGADDQFCNKERKMHEKVEEQQGTLVYSQKRERFMISTTAPATVDETTYYIICQQPDQVEKNSKVTFSGTAYEMEQEQGQPMAGGTSVYFLKVGTIKKTK